MTDVSTLIYAITAFAGLSLAALVGLAAFGKWIDLKRAEIDVLRGRKEDGSPAIASRIELADLRERLRKLEAIAAGVDL
ncbi:MAG: hypothetical protein EBS21_10160 [Sphingomonadaceae bacterium]|nr:hypothetical protein [Sphingomonadaceae bacterium]